MPILSFDLRAYSSRAGRFPSPQGAVVPARRLS